MNTVEKIFGFVMITILFWSGFGSLLWGLAAAVCVVGICIATERVNRAHSSSRR